MKILGVSAFYHDAAACLLVDGQIIAAAQEERFTRRKHDPNFPFSAIKFCLEFGELAIDDIDYVVFYEKPFLKFERILETYLAFAPKGFTSFSSSLPVWVKDKLFQKAVIAGALNKIAGKKLDWEHKLLFSEHHLSHAASAFYPSPFENAAILTLDGVGEWATTSLAVGRGNEITLQKEIQFPHSLGLLYSAFTYYTGFRVNSGEYKLMGLAPYGSPKYVAEIYDHLIEVKEDGSYFLDMSFFNFATGLTMTGDKFHSLFGGPPRPPESELTQKEMDLAASIQTVLEDVVLKLARNAAETTGEKNLCLAGGVALNCVANGRLFREGIFENIWIQPAAGDAGGALGAALAANHMLLQEPRKIYRDSDSMKGSFLGPSFSDEDVRERLSSLGAVFHPVSTAELIDKVSSALAEGNAVGWMYGRMEFGPRALGSRSILADPRSSETQKNLNLKVKFRESFRPFAPSVLREHLTEWFDLDVDSPYMLLVAEIAPEKQILMSKKEENLFGIDKLNVPRSQVPAVTHVDYSARIQTVHQATNPVYHAVLERFNELTGVPILVNTSFNVRGEPIVCSPEDAFRCFMGTDLDLLVVGNNICFKSEQSSELAEDYRDKYELD